MLKFTATQEAPQIRLAVRAKSETMLKEDVAVHGSDPMRSCTYAQLWRRGPVGVAWWGQHLCTVVTTRTRQCCNVWNQRDVHIRRVCVHLTCLDLHVLRYVDGANLLVFARSDTVCITLAIRNKDPCFAIECEFIGALDFVFVNRHTRGANGRCWSLAVNEWYRET